MVKNPIGVCLNLRTLLILFSILIISGVAWGAEQSAAPGMVIRAYDLQHDVNTDLLVATGQVEMTWKDMVMTADRAEFHRATQILTASGNVSLTKAGETLQGDSLVLEAETGRAEMENGRIMMVKDGIRASGNKLIRKGEERYILEDGSLTSCEAENPSWRFGTSELDVTVEEYATGKNVVFYVKDIPVFYFPYIIFPVMQERRSGLLFPKFGSSSKRGVFVDIPFYWAISPSQEATINLDAQTKRGVGLGLDYRYLRNRNSTGSLGGYIIYDNNEDKVRGQLVQSHKEHFSDSLSLVTSINLTTDRDFLSDYSDKSGEYNRQYYDSRAVLTKNWNQWLASAQAIYTQDFQGGSNNKTLQRLPELSLHGVREQVPFIPNLYFDLDLTATNYYREKGMDGRRALLEPRISYFQPVWDGRLNLSLYGSVQMRGYDTNQPEPGVKDNSFVAIPKAGAELSSSISKVYDLRFFDIQKIRHELIPAVSYQYVGNRDQEDLPQFDLSDRVNNHQTITLGLTSNFGGKVQQQADGPVEYRNLMTLRLLQSYSPDGLRDDPLSVLPDQGRWGDLKLESETYLHKNFAALVDLRYSHENHKIASTAVGGLFNDQRGNAARISYRMVDEYVDYLEAGLSLAITRPFYIGANTRYSFDKRDSIETNIGLEYRHQCWSVILGYQERPGNRTWSVNFNLAGLFGTASNSFGYNPAMVR